METQARSNRTAACPSYHEHQKHASTDLQAWLLALTHHIKWRRQGPGPQVWIESRPVGRVNVGSSAALLAECSKQGLCRRPRPLDDEERSDVLLVRCSGSRTAQGSYRGHILKQTWLLMSASPVKDRQKGRQGSECA